MGAYTFNSQPAGTQTAATFRAIIQGIHNGLIAAGLVQTSDTGQVNIASTGTPGAQSTMGYEIYRFNDALQATHPLFVRVDYESGNSTGGRQDIGVTVGKSTDGAGNLSGIFGAKTKFGSASSGTVATMVDSYISGGPGYLTMAMWCSTVNTLNGGFLVVERRIDADGVMHGDSLIKYSATNTTNVTDQLCYRYSDQVGLSFARDLKIPSIGAAVSMGLGVLPVYPLTFCMAPGLPPWQPTSFLAVPPIDNPGNPFQVQLNGVTRTYLCPQMISLFTVYAGVTVLASAFAIRYE